MVEGKLLDKTRWWSREDLLLILLLGIFLYLPGLGQVALFDRDEPRFATAGRTMLTTSDYIVPYFNGQLRPDKPPLLYWLMSVTYQFAGQNELGARLPSAICGMLTLVVVYFAAGWRFGRLTGILAALMLGATSLFIVEARLATADATMVLFTTIAMACAWRIWESTDKTGNSHVTDRVPGFLPTPHDLTDPCGALDTPVQAQQPRPAPVWVALLFWVALALGIMAKGVPLLFVLLPLVVLSLSTGSRGAADYRLWRRMDAALRLVHLPSLLWSYLGHGNWGWWRQLRPRIGVPLLIVLVGWWVLAAGLATHWELLRQMVGVHFLVRIAGPLWQWFGVHFQDLAGSGGQDPMRAYTQPPGFYLALVWVTFWPWCVLLIPAGFHTVRRLRGRTALTIDPRPYQFLVAWIVPMWIALELARGKLVHYVLPLYVPLIILCADTLVQSWHRLSDVLAARWFGAAKWVWLTIWLGLAAGALLLPGYLLLPGPAANLRNLCLPLAEALAAVGIAGTFAWGRPTWPYITVLGYGAVLLLLNTMVLPSIDELQISKRLMTEAVSWQRHGYAIGAIGYNEPTLVFYSRGPVLPMFGSVQPDIVKVFAPGPKYLIPEANVQNLNQPGYYSPGVDPMAEAIRQVTDPAQASMFVVDQKALDDLDAAQVHYQVVMAVYGFRTEAVNDLKTYGCRLIGKPVKLARQFRAALIANMDPYPVTAAASATSPTTTQTHTAP